MCAAVVPDTIQYCRRAAEGSLPNKFGKRKVAIVQWTVLFRPSVRHSIGSSSADFPCCFVSLHVFDDRLENGRRPTLSEVRWLYCSRLLAFPVPVDPGLVGLALSHPSLSLVDPLRSHCVPSTPHLGRTHTQMVLWESFCAAAFTAGSAACILQLLSPQPTTGSMPFVATMLLTCLLSVFALLSVKGAHACWRPSSGSPWKSSSSSSSSGAKAASAGDRSSKSPTAGGWISDSAKDETGASTTAPPPCDDESGDEGAGPEDFPLERRSSFVVRHRIPCWCTVDA